MLVVPSVVVFLRVFEGVASTLIISAAENAQNVVGGYESSDLEETNESFRPSQGHNLPMNVTVNNNGNKLRIGNKQCKNETCTVSLDTGAFKVMKVRGRCTVAIHASWPSTLSH